MHIKDLDVTKRILVEDKALKAMMRCVETGEPPTDEMLNLVRQVQANKPPDNMEGRLTFWALDSILGKNFEPDRFPLVPSGQADTRFFEYVAKAWSCWRAGDLRAASTLLEQLEDDEGTDVPGGALHMMALDPWRDAVAALVRGDRDEAQRLYQRSIEAGSQFGTWTNTAVQWTYAASFLTHE